MTNFPVPAAARRATFTLVFAALLTSGCSLSNPPLTQMRQRATTLNGVANSAHGNVKLDDLSLAASALQSGDLSLASAMYGKVLEQRPDDVDALSGMGATLALSGEWERARSMYERAAAHAPERTQPTLGLARIALRQRRLDEALALYQQVLAREPSNPLASAGLGTVYALRGDTARAQATYRDALQRHPGDTMLTIDLGLSMVLAGDVRKGANLLLSITGEPGAPPQARQDLALAYGLLGNDDAADRILMHDLPRTTTDDDLAFYKLVRARLDGAQAAGIQQLRTSKQIGVQSFAAPLPTIPVLKAGQSLTALAPPSVPVVASMDSAVRRASRAAQTAPPSRAAAQPLHEADPGLAAPTSLAAAQPEPAAVPSIQPFGPLQQTPLLDTR